MTGVELMPVTEDVEGPVLGEESRRLAESIMARYPTRRSALLPLLYLVQAEVGWVPRQGMREVGDIIGLTTAEVEAVATFYTMLKLHPCGRYVISVCTNPSCALLGARQSYERARDLLGDDAERVTGDGLLTLEEEECLAACDKAPVVAVNYVFFDHVTSDRMEQLIADIRRGTVPEAARGAGVPGDLKEVSRTLAGVGAPRSDAPADQEPSEDEESPTRTQRDAPTIEEPAAGDKAHGPMGEGEAREEESDG
ncbi:MAG: NAD(P)H-dependent oxidoreductase subunit E [Actinomycetota bacterium]